jgi:hypothetical protein
MADDMDNRDRVAYLRLLAVESLDNYAGGFSALERVDRDLKWIFRSLDGLPNHPGLQRSPDSGGHSRPSTRRLSLKIGRSSLKTKGSRFAKASPDCACSRSECL